MTLQKARTEGYRDVALGGCNSATVERRADGTCVLRSAEPLAPFPRRLTDKLEYWAAREPSRTLAARRGADGEWIRISYAQMVERARLIGQSLLDRGLGADRPLAILSGNDLEHLSLAFGCQWAGIPYAPISPGASLLSTDFAKLRHAFEVLTPGLVYAADASYERAVRAVAGDDLEVVVGEGLFEGRISTSFSDLLEADTTKGIDAAHAAVGPDTIVKFLFTSGSTGLPKAVVNNQRMICANLQMALQTFAFMRDEPPVLVDWLPWNHTFGGNQNVGLTVYNGGTLYIDEGRPTPDGMTETLRNLREISPTAYFNVPAGYEKLVSAMDHDIGLRDSLFRRLSMLMYAGAVLPQSVWDRLDAHAVGSIGQRVRMVIGLGSTETAPSCTFALGPDLKSGDIGLPCPGVEAKLVPLGDAFAGKSEMRFRGPNVTPGYWRSEAATAAAFDEEGFYKTGDAARFVDTDDPDRGLAFDGRIAEDFKLTSGTFVSVAAMRAAVMQAGAPYVQDIVVAGADRDSIGALVFVNAAECRQLAALPADAPLLMVVGHPAVVERFQHLADKLARQGTGSASRIAWVHLLGEAPSPDNSESTDKGSINQRALLSRRAALVDDLYAGREPRLLKPRGR